MNTKASEASSVSECCMCGDRGFSDELFQCKLCHFRSQHRYCSNLYPKVQCKGICNWCLIQKEEITDKSPKSSNSSSSFKNIINANVIDDDTKIKKFKSAAITNTNNNNNTVNAPLPQTQFAAGAGRKGLQIKKQRSPEARSPAAAAVSPATAAARKRIVTNGALEERLRRTKSEDMGNRNGIIRHGFRNKVRRYKLLDEVIS